MASSQPNKAGSLTVWGGILLALLFLNGFGAIVGGIGLMRNAMPFPDVWLRNTPFHNYLLPGLILILAVGSTQFAAAYVILRRPSLTKDVQVFVGIAAAFAGIILTGWMIGELILIGFRAPIQVWFVGVGLLEFGLSFAPLRHS